MSLPDFSFVPNVTPASVGIWGIFGLVLTALIKLRPAMRKLQIDSDTSLRTELMDRIDVLEAQVQSLEKQNAIDRERYASDLQITRHKLNNETMALDGLFMLMEAAPERWSENISMIKALRAERARNVAVEQGARRTAATSVPGDQG